MDWSAGQGRLIAGGKALEWRSFGPAPEDAPSIVMLHEGLGCVALWRDFPERVAQATGWGMFVYSRAGYGQSDPADLPRPLDYMTREAVEVLPQVLDGIGFRRGILMGHSDGATIAAIYAGSVEDFRVRGLILMAPHFFTEEMGLAEIALAKTAFETGGLRDRMARYHADPDNAFRGWNDAWLDPEFKAWDVSEVIDYIRVPTLAIQGAKDQYGTLLQIEEIADRSYAPVDVLVPEGARHAPHLDASEAVLAEVAGFCARLERIEKATPDAA
ncbi:alpha/beta fold hydrolase [Thetidibacter halocola]|uniref:Alpha/beta hydrolase n=1 Tax=Thetidibacter halocola TaxID=2827239 RepID=A0A8J7WFS9_9RHOB|nr:alpha/beta hydrolase [Thetidibacter halocola]MBS0126012.1 alpha/beta hydrolase [Thetidibacter halocola]